jgi:ElaB/YqjD/DUF883 family membrane-anchored ribosome-binding protein
MNFRKIMTMGILAVLLVGLVALAFPVGSVFADTPTPQPQKDPQALAGRINARLEKAFRELQKMVDNQARHMQRADDFIARAETLIGKAKANGKDTSALEAAVAAFKAKESDFKKLNSAAADILKTHAGFDANGKVVNRDQARQTLQDGREKMSSARELFTNALKKLHEAFKTWRQANPPQKP